MNPLLLGDNMPRQLSAYFQLSAVFLLSLLLMSLALNFLVGPHSYGHGSILYPSIVAAGNTVGYLMFGISEQRLWRHILLGAALSWFSGSIALFIDSTVNNDFASWFFRSEISRYMMITGFFVIPLVLLTPLVGGVVFLIVRFVRGDRRIV